MPVGGDVRAAAEVTAGADVLQVKQPAMLVALMTKSKVDTRAVLSGSPNKVGHDLWNVKGQLTLGLSRHVGEPAGGAKVGPLLAL